MISRLKFGRAVLFLTIYMGIFTAVLKFIGLGLFSAQNIITIIFFLSFILLISQGIIKIESKIEVIFLYYFGVKLILNLIQYSDNFTNINDFLVVVNFYFLLKFFLSFNEQSKISIIKCLDNYFIIISAIVISQFFFSNILPTAFTELPNTKEAAYAAEGYFRATDEGVVFRPNGLVGNPLELGLLLNIFLYMRFYFRENVFTYRGTILIILNIILILILNSRANTILALIVTLYWGLKKKGGT